MTQPPLPRSEFAVTDRYVYLNHAATGVPPLRTREALKVFIDAQAQAGVLGVYPYENRMPEFRARIAGFIGARDGTVAVLRNTGDGANIIASGLDWKAGDEIVVPRDEFPANLYPWLALQKRGVIIRSVDSPARRLTPDVLRAMMNDRVRIVAVSWVAYHDGYMLDLPALAEIAHDSGALFCVDAIQGLGAFPLDVRAAGIDALYASGAKWLLALQGVGFVYLSPDLLDRLELAAPGWRSVADIWDFDNHDQPLASDAARFEGGTPNFIGALSLATSMEFLEAHDRRAVAAHVLALTDRLYDGLRSLGATLRTVRGEGISSGIVTYTFDGVDPIEFGRALQRRGFVTTWRPTGIRVAPHGYNTVDEIDAYVAAVRDTHHARTIV